MKWFCVLLVLLCAVPAGAQTFPARAQDIVNTLYERNKNLADGTDDERRALTRQIIEQLVCEFPNDGYGGKSADPGRPFSKDAIAQTISGRFIAWDWQNGASRRPQVPIGFTDITGQNPIPVGCINHLNGGPVSTPVNVDNSSLDDAIAVLTAEQRAFRASLNEQIAKLAAEVTATHISLEQHREAMRQERSKILAWITNWKNLAALGGGLVAGWQVTK